MEVCTQEIGIIKPQVAYYERYGADGLRLMKETSINLKKAGNVLIYDAKRGDIGATSSAYAKAYFGSDSPFQADAITVTPTLGFGSIRPILEYASDCGGGVFIVVRSSNPEGKFIQQALCSDGRTIAEYLADEITAFNTSHLEDGLGPVGAVIGATVLNAEPLLKRMPSALFLSPGIGAQGGTFPALRQSFGASSVRAIPSSSRAILMKGPDVNVLIKEIRNQRQLSYDLCH